ncbi:DUF6443 domain-containing protein [Alistipes communis]|uniref:DUF6443 domain-containing protein n=4 Tax=Bacteroidales TaxID=171549 RepID=UPI00114205E0|nr:DUF6443 domain-containing protein [Alistipes communis]BBL14360.1 cell wall-associated protein [Alistipes communis]
MKRHILLFAFLLCSAGRIGAQDSGSNWIKTRTAISETGTTITDITYYNGLGLPSQTTNVRASVNGYNIVTPIVYDALLRSDATAYLPFEATYYSDEEELPNSTAISEQRNYYEERYSSDYERSFTEKVYEASPLGRVRKQALPGYMKDYEVLYTEFDYRTNDTDEVRWLAVGVDGELVCEGCHDAGTLSCTVTTDPDDHVVQSFTDGLGRTLLSRTFDDDEPIDTYSVYDDYGRLRWVVTPEGSYLLSDSLTVPVDDDFAEKYCYVYTYNDRGLMVEKRMPGREAEYMRYDEGDRLRVSQDGNLRAKKQWISYSYDALGRVQEQSLAVEAELIPIRSQAGVSIGEPIESVEPPYLGSSVPLRKYVYDTYPSEVQAAGLDFQSIEGLTATDGESLRYDNATGSLTYEKLAVLANDTITGYHQRACYYDYKGRLIQIVERDTEDGILCTSKRYDFVGNLIAQRESYTRAGKTDDIDRTFTYDDRGRLLNETTQVNGGEEAVVYYEYDELGRLAARRLGEGTSAIAEQSEYDIRSWLTKKSSELFDMSLGHSYTENITSWQWQHKGDPSGDGPQNRYVFTYDGLSRLANTTQYVNGELNKQNVERFLTYDRNGNLQTFIRYENGSCVSNSTYNYSGNRLVSYCPGTVFEREDVGIGEIIVPKKGIVFPLTVQLHQYDANGNVTKDWERGLDMSYNCLNLLEYASDNDANAINYCYLADGTKLSVTDVGENGLYYLGSLVYEKHANTIGLESAGFSSGRIVATAGNDTEIRYFLTDHLGSVRVVATDKDNVLERNDYQPFGKRWNTASLPVSDNRDRFNGKEDQSFAGLPFSDYSARMYDRERGRWLSQDPKSEDYFSSTQYGFCGNNPIRYIDPSGMAVQKTDSVQVIDIDPITVTTYRNNPLSNAVLLFMWSAAEWGEMWNYATGHVNSTFNNNLVTGMNLWSSIAISWGISK